MGERKIKGIKDERFCRIILIPERARNKGVVNRGVGAVWITIYVAPNMLDYGCEGATSMACTFSIGCCTFSRLALNSGSNFMFTQYQLPP